MSGLGNDNERQVPPSSPESVVQVSPSVQSFEVSDNASRLFSHTAASAPLSCWQCPSWPPAVQVSKVHGFAQEPVDILEIPKITESNPSSQLFSSQQNF